jgi:succinate dehydrogenase flavin-adding protein (antitoxin of CptAB toxin-antitoxin module)
MRDVHTASEDPQEGDFDLRRLRLLFPWWHGGTRESDLILGSFAETSLTDLDSSQLHHGRG